MKYILLFVLLLSSFVSGSQVLTSADSIHMVDSVMIQKLAAELNEFKMRELVLQGSVQSRRDNRTKDSIKLVLRQQRIDSLRNNTVGVPVVIDSDTLFCLYAMFGKYTPQKRASMIESSIESIGAIRAAVPDSIFVSTSDNLNEIRYEHTIIMTVTENDALWMNMSLDSVTTIYKSAIISEIKYVHEQNSLWRLFRRIAGFITVLIAIAAAIFGISLLFRRLNKWITTLTEVKLHSLKIKDYELLNTNQQESLLLFLAKLMKYVTILLLLIFTVPLLFAIFPQTKDLANTLFGYILIPVKGIVKGMVDYIPKFFKIAVIVVVVRYMLKGIKYIANEIKEERLKITGFYPDWAHPTYSILKFLINAFMLALIYPLLPGSDSDVFKGVSVFVGLIFSLGSTTIISNIVAGLVITYMRPFKIGDRIKLNDTVGNVIEKTTFVIRIRTIKNEIVTIPNSFIMSAHIINYSTSSEDLGLILHTTVTIGYDAPWRTVHALLIDAAKSTPGVLQEPEPFVLQTELSDYYPVYQLNAYVSDANKSAIIYSDLHKNIQDKFNEAGVEIMSPLYVARRDGDKSTIPDAYIKK